ncbi:MAG: hypothetical protein RR014_00945 [Bilophila sp.]
MSATSRALMAWGEPLPDWIEALATACDAQSMRKVAADLKVSAALISLALRNCHHAKLDYIMDRVKSMLMVSIVSCPVLGMINTTDCIANQKKAFSSVNPLQVQLYRACHGRCLYSKNKETDNDC